MMISVNRPRPKGEVIGKIERMLSKGEWRKKEMHPERKKCPQTRDI